VLRFVIHILLLLNFTFYAVGDIQFNEVTRSLFLANST